MAQSGPTGRRRVGPHVEILEDHTAQVEGAIKKLANTTVMVGIPSDDEVKNPFSTGSNRRTGGMRGDMNNATLGYIHETGAPAANIPARPFLRPGVRESSGEWIPYLRQAGKAALEGKDAIMDRALNAAGMKAVSAVKNRITAGIPPPLSQRTVDARRARTPSRQARVSADTTPLVDTAQMLNSITYVVRYRGRR